MRTSATCFVLLLASSATATGMLACFSTPTDPNAGRALELPPTPDGGAGASSDGGDAASDSSAADAAPDSAPPTDSGGGG